MTFNVHNPGFKVGLTVFCKGKYFKTLHLSNCR